MCNQGDSGFYCLDACWKTDFGRALGKRHYRRSIDKYVSRLDLCVGVGIYNFKINSDCLILKDAI